MKQNRRLKVFLFLLLWSVATGNFDIRRVFALYFFGRHSSQLRIHTK